MRIQHNIMAMNAYRNYNTNTSALSKNLEKLSSGYKINRAGDDAAGLAISEKMRAQISGLNAASKNVKDGISLVKTAEGAMQEIQDMLNRMKYLATQSANGTYDDDVDRFNLQKEVESLRSEIDRIADSANFNGINLLDGKMGFGSSSTNAAAPTAPTAEVDATNAAKLGDVSIAFADGVSDADKAALNAALTAGEFKFTTTDEGDSNWGAGDKIQLDKLPTGYTAKFVAGDGTEVAMAAGTDITAGAAADNDKFDATKDLEIKLYDANDNEIATLTVGKPTAGATGTSTVTFAAANAAAATTAPTFTESETAGSQLSDFGVASIDFSSVKIDAETDIKLEYVADDTDGTLKLTVGDTVYSYQADDTATNLQGAEVELDDGNGNKIKVTLADDNAVVGNNVVTQATDSIAEATVGKLTPAKTTGGAGNGTLTLQIGDTADSFNQLTVKIGDMHVSSLGKRAGTADVDANGKKTGTYTYADVVTGQSIADIDISTIGGAQTAISVIKDAINYVSSVRGDLGATQNRLEHTANNLSVMTENIQDAESTIRDTDVAEEMMAYTKNNILIQSAQAMLAQANQVPQGVLQLLQ